MESPIPIVDFTEGSIDQRNDELKVLKLKNIGGLLSKALEECGAVYLLNTGIKQKQVSPHHSNI